MSSPSIGGVVEVLLQLVHELDVGVSGSEFRNGYICRSCLGLLQKYCASKAKLSCALQKRWPQIEAGLDPGTSNPPIQQSPPVRVPSTEESPALKVVFVLFNTINDVHFINSN